MRGMGTGRALIGATLAVSLLGGTALAQYREYYIHGRIVDTTKQPIPGVEIQLRDVETSRSYHMKTDKDGAFKFAGLPHGVYEATLSKQGYPQTKVEWKFEAPQDTMQPVEIPEIVLASQAQVQEAAEARAAEAGAKDAAEKIRQRDFDGAIAQLQTLLEEQPANASLSFLLGLAYSGKQMYPEAIVALTRVTELDPAFPGAFFKLGVCHQRLRDLPQALAAFEKSLDADPRNADAAYDTGLVLFELGRIDEALARFEQGLAVKPQDPDLLEMAGRCYVNQAKLDKALEAFEKARAATTDAAKATFLDQLIAQVKAGLK
jgi:tetratricopeptide (TPR) repeat protein